MTVRGPDFNNDVELVGSVIIQDLGDGVVVQFFPPNGHVKNLLFMSGTTIHRRPVTIQIQRRPGGRVAEVKR